MADKDCSSAAADGPSRADTRAVAGWRRIRGALVGLLVAIYPLLVYYGLARFSVAAMAGLLAAIALLRLALAGRGERRQLLPLAGLMLALATGAAVSESELLLRFYPVLINTALFAWFAWTLVRPPSALERLMAGLPVVLTEHAYPYLHKLTMFWCGFFVFNGSIAAWTAFLADLRTWALYNGLIVYLLIGAIFIVEYFVRRAYRRRVGDA